MKYYNEYVCACDRRVCVSVSLSECLSVCLSVCLFVCLQGYLQYHMRDFYQSFVHVAYGRARSSSDRVTKFQGERGNFPVDNVL